MFMGRQTGSTLRTSFSRVVSGGNTPCNIGLAARIKVKIKPLCRYEMCCAEVVFLELVLAGDFQRL